VIVTGSDASVPKPGPSNLALRWISSLILAPLVVAIAWYSGWPFVLLCTIGACIVLWEWSMLVRGADPPVTLASFAVWMVAGLVYAAALLLAPIVLRGDAALGFVAIVFLFAIVWSTDVFAYFAGRALGGPKLMPAVSPKKTWSGAAGGTLGALVAGLIVVMAAGLQITFAVAAVALFLSVVSQLGDLLESAIKRHFGAKDSSQLLPGHGGLMDRLDGFLTAALAAAMVGLLRGGFEAPARGLLTW
jgi:phosphatidate cytidylyltransferase